MNYFNDRLRNIWVNKFSHIESYPQLTQLVPTKTIEQHKWFIMYALWEAKCILHQYHLINYIIPRTYLFRFRNRIWTSLAKLWIFQVLQNSQADPHFFIYIEAEWNLANKELLNRIYLFNTIDGCMIPIVRQIRLNIFDTTFSYLNQYLTKIIISFTETWRAQIFY